VRPKEELRAPRESALAVFDSVLESNLEKFAEQRRLLLERDLIHRGRYIGAIALRLANTADVLDASRPGKTPSQCDLLVTSPPYGDNLSTVPYGQHSYLPLQWINKSDAGTGSPSHALTSTNAIDRSSLGGELRNAMQAVRSLYEISPTLERTILGLSDSPPDRAKRVAAFSIDMARCVRPILHALSPNAYMFFTIGNRRVGDRQVPLDQIVIELFKGEGASLVTAIGRTIPVKRMAIKNSVSETMRSETVVLMRNVGKP
jgi:hypothetical protein